MDVRGKFVSPFDVRMVRISFSLSEVLVKDK